MGLDEGPKRDEKAIKKARAGRLLAPAPSLAAGGEVLIQLRRRTPTSRLPREVQSRRVFDGLGRDFVLIFDDKAAMPLSKCQGYACGT